MLIADNWASHHTFDDKPVYDSVDIRYLAPYCVIETGRTVYVKSDDDKYENKYFFKQAKGESV